MSKTIRILSRAHTGMVLREPMPETDKPGEATPLRQIVLDGNGAVSTVDAEVFEAWKKANPNDPLLVGGVIEEIGDDHEAPEEVFGHEPALKAHAGDPEAVKASEAGVQVEAGPGQLTSEDMTPTNGTPPGDDPGEPRHASQPGEPEPGRTTGAAVQGTTEAVETDEEPLPDAEFDGMSEDELRTHLRDRGVVVDRRWGRKTLIVEAEKLKARG
ncbi:hypothetical protein [Methylobacterium frigidaeris]|uniref:Uncharacterized protein n=1 Tax=Methylobacterium frigidaeris TaxID=2038277 RepID=A0AA37M5J8_9HYPH|nr:hypothetical protein [Methylobacterium frigidaeris]GJD63758.1 hypothetical protein MPEAHAMD_3929 [Methylobacterium frigidaeris]